MCNAACALFITTLLLAGTNLWTLKLLNDADKKHFELLKELLTVNKYFRFRKAMIMLLNEHDNKK